MPRRAQAPMFVLKRHRARALLRSSRSRVRGIENLSKANGIDDGIKSRWISGGSSIEAVSEDLLKIVKARGEKTKSIAHVGLSDRESRQYSLARAIRACADQNWAEAGFEAEVSREIGKRMGKVSDKMRSMSLLKSNSAT
jgi:hypothetical protein